MWANEVLESAATFFGVALGRHYRTLTPSSTTTVSMRSTASLSVRVLICRVLRDAGVQAARAATTTVRCDRRPPSAYPSCRVAAGAAATVEGQLRRLRSAPAVESRLVGRPGGGP